LGAGVDALAGELGLEDLSVERVVIGVDRLVGDEARPVRRSDALGLPGRKNPLLDPDQPPGLL
jgi:hypothetical protein